MTRVADFADRLAGHDVLFHTAAHFRDSYKGGDHWDELYRVNVEGTRALLQAAHNRGLRRMVHTSSIAVLDGPPGMPVDETMSRDEANADDYYRSKIVSERVVTDFLADKPDMWAAIVLPGWMHGPGDVGPTSAGVTVLDFVRGKLPGVPPGSFSVVDARDVARVQIAAATKGRRGERYLAAGRHMEMGQLFPLLEAVSGTPAPKRPLPIGLLYVLATVEEFKARVFKKPALISLATVKLIARERGRTQFDHSKTERELGVTFRPVQDTLADEVGWYRANGYLPTVTA
jgi:nucleoside-diphosphate-sugar epimerase